MGSLGTSGDRYGQEEIEKAEQFRAVVLPQALVGFTPPRGALLDQPSLAPREPK